MDRPRRRAAYLLFAHNVMLDFLLRPLRLMAQSLIGDDSPRRVAWGFALGMLAGMLPKGNLLAVVLGMLLFGLQVNKSAGLLAAGLFSLLAPLWDGLAHTLGSAMLASPTLQPWFATLYQAPLGRFVGLTNTVVLGQAAIGLYCLYPAYLAAWWAAATIRPRIAKWLLGYRVIRWLKGAEIGAQLGLQS
ncbi:MAG: TIGR03546 family protein [Planctomycetales bacterium]|nr:TIGR03546 family protein [Planctomycetales bacterium]